MKPRLAGTGALAGVEVLHSGRRRTAPRILTQLGATVREAGLEEIELAVTDGAASTVVSIEPAPEGVLEGCHPAVIEALVDVHAVFAGLAALRAGSPAARVSTFEVVLGCLGEALPEAVCGEPAPVASTEVLPCKDGFVSLSAGDAARADLAALATPESIEQWLAARTRVEAAAEAQAWRIPMLPVDAPTPPEPSPFHFKCAQRHQPSAGLTVLDLGMMWAGPYCGRLLAGIGAEVIKIESRKRQDGTRHAGRTCGGVFADLNGGKQSLALDLGTPSGRTAFLALAKRANVVLDNFSRRVMPNFGLGPERLLEANPRLTVVSMPAFAEGTSEAGYVAYGSGLELMAGLAPEIDGRPEPSPIAYLDYLSGCYAAIAVLAAQRAGGGARVEVAQHDVARQLSGRLGYRPDVARLIEAAGELARRNVGRTAWQGPASDRRAKAAGELARRNLRRTSWPDPASARRAKAAGELAQRCQGEWPHVPRMPFRLSGVRLPALGPARQLGADGGRVLRRYTWMGPTRVRHLAATEVLA